MTVEKTRAEVRKAALVKAARSIIRLRHSLNADAELNAALPELEKAFDRALQSGALADDIDVQELARRALAPHA